ncbi:hypothetical protein JYU34_008683 [Plutella xylostella]|uniref:Galectin n=1 Tax=Plutella xylostella TaxID=51655 RepID=A0ABQ7QLP0_PLUXY|nr:hypothetical protein JYU34_008683 [Plutella xylostella]
MVCSKRCGCGAFCRRFFCGDKDKDRDEKNCEEEIDEDGVPVTLTQLAESRDVRFLQPLTEPLRIGSHIVCTGTPDEDLPWFTINIGTGGAMEARPDVAVHFNVRMPQRYVVRNTRRHARWGPEENTSFKSFPFKFERSFTIEVIVDETETLWAVDGAHYCSYAHRNPAPFTAAWVQVIGIRDASLNVQTCDVYPMLAPPPLEVPKRASYDSEPDVDVDWQPNVIASLESGIPEGYQLVLKGRLRPLLHSFTLDLTDRACEWPRANVHLHANLRAHADAQLSRQLVVLNAWLGAWGAERRQRSAQLVPGTKTTFRIVRGPGEWSVYADGLVIGELEYRAHPDGVKALRIRGDFYPDDVYLCPNAYTPAPRTNSFDA